MKRKFITAIKAIALPLVFIFILQLLNPLASFIKTNSKYNQVLLGITAITIAITISYFYDKNTKNTLTPNTATIGKTLLGLFTGLIAASLMILTLLTFSNLKIEHSSNINYLSIFFSSLLFFPLAYFEEIIFRGNAFINLKSTLGMRSAQIIFALLFAYYHDPAGSTFGAQLLGPGVWAVIYGWSAIKFKGIAFPVGLHAGLNITQGVFGMKEDRYAIWNLYYDSNLAEHLKDKTEFIGILMQIVVLIVGILLTEKLIKKNPA
ncbi:CPBP family intramembrane metalloprotease [Tenacibaculum sp. 190130A14a]|uniref:CPBP family intramembrane metalloprotease n=1 Tax=Tenacibaculum polynesiense TaxID=3137857 RepID=A0ABP1F267_9FLAO